MKVMAINPAVSFRGNIVDSHLHTGNWSPEGASYVVGDILELTGKPLNVDVNGVAQQDTVKFNIISSLDCLEKRNGRFLKDEYGGNIDFLNETKKTPSIRRLAVCQPGHGEVENITKLFDENPDKFIGLKFHPENLELPADSNLYEPYMRFAQEHKLPCLFHTGGTNSNSCPKKVYALAKRFPDVPVIMAHLGAGTDHKEAVNVLLESIEKNDALLYCDTSWVDFRNPETPVMKDLIERLQKTSKGDKTDRILFGTDAPLGEFGAPGKKIAGFYEQNVSMFKTSIKKNFGKDSDKLIDKIFYQNAVDLYKLKEEVIEVTQEASTSAEKLSKTKLGILIGTVVAVGVIIGCVLWKSNKVDVKDK